ncbi:MAG: flagellar biosynthesis protein FliQ [Acetobacteraceae bacterium]|nr:flagellar biosynthesis protein FliQ [Acetobacteraceae bacterium]
MQESDLAQLLRDTFLVLFKLGGPVLAVGLAVGVVMSLIQAITQINEPALAFVPKVAAIVTTLVLAGPFMLTTLRDYTTHLFDHLIQVGGG